MATETNSLEHIAKNTYSGNGHDSPFQRFYTRDIPAGKTVYDTFEYELKTAKITNDKGKVLFVQEGVEVPKGWSDTAINIVASKYFRRKDVPDNKIACIEGSSGFGNKRFLEIDVQGKSAAIMAKLKVGDKLA